MQKRHRGFFLIFGDCAFVLEIFCVFHFFMYVFITHMTYIHSGFFRRLIHLIGKFYFNSFLFKSGAAKYLFLFKCL